MTSPFGQRVKSLAHAPVTTKFFYTKFFLTKYFQHEYFPIYGTEKQRQCRHDNVRLTESGNARSEQLLVVPSAYRVTNQLRMAARRALEWIGASKPGWFLDMKCHTC